jgi:syndecan 4
MSLSFFPSDASEIVLPPGSSITVLIKQGTPDLPAKPCYIVVSRRHLTVLFIKAGEKVVVTFTCQNPEKHFVLEIQKNIGEFAPGAVGSVSGPSLPFLPLLTPVVPAMQKAYVGESRSEANPWQTHDILSKK